MIIPERLSSLESMRAGEHCLPADRVEGFVEVLRAHAHREENVFYPWVDRQLQG